MLRNFNILQSTKDPPFVFAENISANTALSEMLISGWMVDLWKDLQNVLKFKWVFKNT